MIMCPSDEAECRNMLYTAYQYPGTAVVRYPRGGGTGIEEDDVMQALEMGKAKIPD